MLCAVGTGYLQCTQGKGHVFVETAGDVTDPPTVSLGEHPARDRFVSVCLCKVPWGLFLLSRSFVPLSAWGTRPETTGYTRRGEARKTGLVAIETRELTEEQGHLVPCRALALRTRNHWQPSSALSCGRDPISQQGFVSAGSRRTPERNPNVPARVLLALPPLP